jgi:hypothetical protein
MYAILLERTEKLSDKYIEDLKNYLNHLSDSDYNGTILVTFQKGKPTNLSQKEELIVGELQKKIPKRICVVRKMEQEMKPENKKDEYGKISVEK